MQFDVFIDNLNDSSSLSFFVDNLNQEHISLLYLLKPIHAVSFLQ